MKLTLRLGCHTCAARLQVNAWGDQPTLEMVRLIVEWGGFCFLDKDKRGDFKVLYLLLFDVLSYIYPV